MKGILGVKRERRGKWEEMKRKEKIGVGGDRGRESTGKGEYRKRNSSKNLKTIMSFYLQMSIFDIPIFVLEGFKLELSLYRRVWPSHRRTAGVNDLVGVESL